MSTFIDFNKSEMLVLYEPLTEEQLERMKQRLADTMCLRLAAFSTAFTVETVHKDKPDGKQHSIT